MQYFVHNILTSF